MGTWLGQALGGVHAMPKREMCGHLPGAVGWGRAMQVSGPPGRAEGQAGLTASAARKGYRVPDGACTAAISALWPPQQSTTHGATEKRNCCPPDLEARCRKSWCCPGHSQQGLWGRGWALPIPAPGGLLRDLTGRIPPVPASTATPPVLFSVCLSRGRFSLDSSPLRSSRMRSSPT